MPRFDRLNMLGAWARSQMMTDSERELLEQWEEPIATSAANAFG